MKTNLLLFIICVFGSVPLVAQTVRLHVIITNEKLEPFQNATGALYQLPDSVLRGKKVIKGDTWFDVPGNHTYLLKVTASGTTGVNREIVVADSSVEINIRLLPFVAALGNITVVSRKPLIRQEDDKTIVDAEALANSSTNAFEVLEKTPGAVVDQDGNVYLSSTTPATVYINGREMKLSSADIASLLKSLPAGSVSKIEILRTPSAKYDASGSGGIVNIVLKKE